MLTEYYFAHYPILWPYTFLYYEESILTLLCRKTRLRLKQLKEPKLIHLDGVATKKSSEDEEMDIWKMRIWAESSEQFCKVYRYRLEKCLYMMNLYLETNRLEIEKTIGCGDG